MHASGGGSPFINNGGDLYYDIGNLGIGLTDPLTALHVDSNDIDSVGIITIENTSGSNVIRRGVIDPEGNITGNRGDLFIKDFNNEGLLYVKRLGNGTNTGWKKLHTSSYGEMHIPNNVIPTAILTQDKPHLIQGLFTDIGADGFTFTAGASGAITFTADNGGNLQVTSGSHGRATGDILSVVGLTTAAQNDITAITVDTVDTFTCDDISYVTSSETGAWLKGDLLTADIGANGKYALNFHAYGESLSSNVDYKLAIYKNITRQANLDAKRRFTLNTTRPIGGNGGITIADGDKITMGLIGLTDLTNFTFEHNNLFIHKI